MKIAYASDLHTEFGLISLPNKEKADVLVLAGDIILATRAYDNPKLEWFFEECAREYKDIIYVMGNHEHYDGDFTQTARLIRKFLYKFPNIHLLDDESITIGDVAFFGGTFWTSMNDRDPYVITEANKFMSDFHVVRNGDHTFSAKDAAIAHTGTIEKLTKFLDENKENKVVVVSHHAPSKKSIHPRYGNDTTINYAYHTDLEGLIGSNPQIKLWFHGHTHSNFDYMVGDTRVLCNPRGYVGYERNVWHFELKYVEV